MREGGVRRGAGPAGGHGLLVAAIPARRRMVPGPRTRTAGRRDRRIPHRSPGQRYAEGSKGDFVLTAKADRVDRLVGGGYAIIDYKTGLPPSRDEVGYGYAPQLPLEAVILAAGGFEGLGKCDTSELAYWRLSGGEPAGEIRIVDGDPGELAEAARKGLLRLIEAFDDPDTPYMATPRPEWATAWNDYEHLARNAEWSAGGGGDE